LRFASPEPELKLGDGVSSGIRYITIMMNGGKALTGLCTAVVLCATAAEAASESAGTPYQGIVDRNVFGLRPPPPPAPPEANKPPPPKIMLTGITTLVGHKPRVLMKVQVPAKPGAKAEEQSMILAAGERQGDIDIEVLEIDEKAGVVKVNDYGTITNLTWENNGVKVAAAPPPVAPAVPQPNPGGFTPGAPVPGMQPGAARAIPTSRPMRTYSPSGAGVSPSSYGGANPAYGGAAYAPPGYAPNVTTPGGVTLPGLGAPATPVTASRNWPPEHSSPEEQAIMDAAYTLKHQNEINNGTLPPLPQLPGGNPLLDGGTENTTPTPTPRSTLPRAPSLPQLLPQ
jgi:hypothetical protein